MAMLLNTSTVSFYLRSALASVCDKFANCGTILHADPCCICVTHGLGLMSIWVIIGKQMYFFFKCAQALQACSVPMQAK